MRRALAVFVLLGAFLLGAAPASATSITGLTVDNTSPSNGAGARTHYTVSFTTSATAAPLSAGSTITVTFPAGTTFGNYIGGDVFVGTPRIGGCQTPNPTTRQITCGPIGANSIPASTGVRLEFTGVTNPPVADDYTLTASTSSDTTEVVSSSYTVADTHPLSGVTVTNNSPSDGAGARTHYTVPFTTSVTGGLSANANSTILVTFPNGTTFGNYIGGDLFLAATRIGGCQTPNPTARQITCGPIGSNSIPANTTARLEFTGITNPSTPGNPTLMVSTSSDTAPVSSSSYTVAAAHTLTILSATPTSTAQSATTHYTVPFTTSVTGGLSANANSTILVTFPNGTTFGNYIGGDLFLAATRIGGCQTPNPTARQITCGPIGANSIPANTTARLEFTGITNPSTPGNYALTVATSSDTGTVTSGQYGIAMDAAAPDTSIVSGPPATTTNPQPTFTFSSNEPGSTFSCSVDGGAFAACTSPFVAPPLAPGSHTFRVRSTDPAGNTDSTPATDTFTVTTTQPSQPPAPTAGKTVVVSEAAGTVLVKAKGSNKFVALNADEGIPLGSTVDTTHGTVVLTSQQKKGGASQSAKFFDGIFLVTQKGSTINLKLTQPLAKCASGKASAAAKKKPKKRRLWGDGKGHFRTQGKHSAATVVGTKWLVQDSCAGTLTKVARGIVSVRDFGKKKTIKVKAGKKYLAKP